MKTVNSVLKYPEANSSEAPIATFYGTRTRRLLRSLPIAILLSCTGAPLQAQTAPASNTTKPDEAIELPPFQLIAEPDSGYSTTRSLSGTKTNELLSELPNPISVLNREFLDDIKVEGNYLEAAQFGVGVQVEATTNDSGMASGDVALSFRGFTTNWQSRDGFQWYVPSDAYNVDRVEFNRGAAALLYGDSGPGGIMNLVTKRAELRDRRSVLVRTDQYGSFRSEIDVNQRVGEKMAVRVNALYSDKQSWQQVADGHQRGVALAFSWEPGPRLADISLRVLTEWGEVKNRHTHGLLANQYSLYPTQAPLDVNDPGAPLPAGTQVIQAAGAKQRWTYIDGSLRNLESTADYQILQSTVPTSNPVFDNVPESLFGKKLNWRGPDYSDSRDFHTVTVELEKSFSPNVWMLLSYNLQNQYREVIGAGSYRNARRDPNRFLPNASGTLVDNPHFDQLYIEHNPFLSSRENVVHNYRWTGLYDLNTRFMRQRFIAALAYRDEQFWRREKAEALRPGVIAATAPGSSTIQADNRVFRRFYLSGGSGDLAPSRSGDNIRFSLSPDTYWAQWLVRNPIQTLSSGSATAFGHYWDNRVHTNLGARRDIWYRLFNSNLSRNAVGNVTGEELIRTDANGKTIRGTTTLEDDLEVDSTNVGAVVDVTEVLGLGDWASVAVNRSNSFVFNAFGTFFNEDPGVAFTGTSKDATLRLAPFENKIEANITYFETSSPASKTGIGASTEAEDEVNALLNAGKLSIPSFSRNGQDGFAEEATGYEVEIIANPTRALTFRFGYSNWDRERTDIFPRFTALVEEMKKVAATPDDFDETETSLNSKKASLIANAKDRHWNLVARYAFHEGKLKGLALGSTAVYRSGTTHILSGHPNLVRGSYTRVNAFIRYAGSFAEWNYNARIDIENLTNEKEQLGGFGGRYYVDPRRVSFSLAIEF